MASLTPWERHVLQVYCESGSTTEAAERLAVAPQTVKNHVSTILRKLGLKRSRQAALWLGRTDEPSP